MNQKTYLLPTPWKRWITFSVINILNTLYIHYTEKFRHTSIRTVSFRLHPVLCFSCPVWKPNIPAYRWRVNLVFGSFDKPTSGSSIVVSKAQVSTLKVFHDLFSSITSLKRGISNWRRSYFHYFFSFSYLETQTETWLRP